MIRPGRLGVFGGAFDPPHIGHRVVALDVCEHLGLKKLIVVPAARPPHRDTSFPATLRLELVRRAFALDDRIDVSDIEYRSDEPSYTVDTLRQIRAIQDADDVWLIIGSDQYAVFETWHQPERILELARLAVMRRGDDTIRPDSRFPFEAVEVTRIDVSGEMIRRRLAAGQSIRYLVPDSIRADIEAEAEHLTGHTEAC
ncbi:MAG: nicotinate (nicotinamide) nucleotide adenylyltransferase [Gemmatimonadota bacterium]|nr:nicotinate (nicotinamide) nucleotide adenylyltransferase [Gemmatimonadota bacterium]MDH3427054.1 nicotinate (nicotinamide) nucleotide adenylyltransferase [Gemmatimonadota bacterium]